MSENLPDDLPEQSPGLLHVLDAGHSVDLVLTSDDLPVQTRLRVTPQTATDIALTIFTIATRVQERLRAGDPL